MSPVIVDRPPQVEPVDETWTFAALVAITAERLILYWILLLPFISLPFLSLAAYWTVSAAIYQHHGGRGQFGLGQAMWMLTWVSGYLAAWQTTIRIGP